MVPINTTIKNDFEIYYREDSNWEPPEHMHDHYELIFVVDGSAKLIIGDKAYDVKPHSLLFINRFERHDIKITSYPYSRFVISMTHLYSMSAIKDEVLLSILFQRPDDFVHVLKIDDSVYPAVFNICSALNEEYVSGAEYNGMNIQALLSLLFVTLYRKFPKAFPIWRVSNIVKVVVDIQHYISGNFEKEILLEDLESRYFLSRYYICRMFKKITGYTLKDYITRQRVLHAKQLLQNTDKSIVKISEECGYNSVNHFNRIFLKREETSPTAYRKAARKAMKQQ